MSAENYQRLVDDINNLLSDNDFESCFEQLKTYIQHNFEGRALSIRYEEVIQHQRFYSSVKSEKRLGHLGFIEANKEFSNIAKNILEFRETLKPADFNLNTNKIQLDNFEYWNYEDNLEATLFFPKEFGLLNKIFEEFTKSKRDDGNIKVERYFFDGRRKIPITNDKQFESLKEEEKNNVVIEPMEWNDAIIFQKRDRDGVILAEAFVRKESEEVRIRASGMTQIYQTYILFEVVNWFRNTPTYPSKMAMKPFVTQIPFPSLLILDMLSTSSSDQKIVTIFLASSYELREDRKEFEILIGRENKRLVSEGIFLKLEIWEDFIEAMSKTRLQDEYNKVISNSDIFVSLFFTKVGKYTEEEFEVALEQLKIKDKKPFIYTYFKDADIKSGSLNDEVYSLLAFKKKLESLGHFHSTYESIEDLKYKFKVQLDKILPQIQK